MLSFKNCFFGEKSFATDLGKSVVYLGMCKDFCPDLLEQVRCFSFTNVRSTTQTRPWHFGLDHKWTYLNLTRIKINSTNKWQCKCRQKLFCDHLHLKPMGINYTNKWHDINDQWYIVLHEVTFHRLLVCYVSWLGGHARDKYRTLPTDAKI